MPGETPDYGVLSAATTVFPVTDLSELAVRLGAISSIDRTGDVILTDSFEDGVRSWWAQYFVAIGAYRSTALAARSGRRAALLSSAIQAGAGLQIYRYLPYLVLSRLGLEAWIALDVNSGIAALHIYYRDGANRIEGRLEYSVTASTLSILNAAGGLTVIDTGVDLRRGVDLFHGFKLVLDPTTQTYARAIVDHRSYNLLAHGLYIAASSGSHYFQVAIEQRSNLASACDVYVDDVIVTQNEVV